MQIFTYSGKLTASNNNTIFIDNTEHAVDSFLHLMNDALKQTI